MNENLGKHDFTCGYVCYEKKLLKHKDGAVKEANYTNLEIGWVESSICI